MPELIQALEDAHARGTRVTVWLKDGRGYTGAVTALTTDEITVSGFTFDGQAREEIIAIPAIDRVEVAA